MPGKGIYVLGEEFALCCVVKTKATALKVYLAAERARTAEGDDREAGGKTRGLISFCIPDYGALFRCRIRSAHDQLLLTAAVTALRFIERSYAGEKVPDIVLCTHVPAGYYALTHEARRKSSDPLGAYREKFSLDVALVDLQDNQALAPVTSLPSHPLDTTPPLKLKKAPEMNTAKMEPLKDWIEL